MRRYYRTNENPRAVLAGLDAQKEDNIVAVGASLDNAIAMLTMGPNIVAIDKSRWQIKYMHEQVELIKDKDYAGFMRNRSKKKFLHGNKHIIVFKNIIFICHKIFIDTQCINF